MNPGDVAAVAMYVVLAFAGGIAGIWAGIKFFGEKFLDAVLERRLEKYKSELALLLAQKQSDLDRGLHEFSMYTTKRNEVYAAIYSALLELQDKLNRLQDPAVRESTAVREEIDTLLRKFHDAWLPSQLFVSEEVQRTLNLANGVAGSLIIDAYSPTNPDAFRSVFEHRAQLRSSAIAVHEAMVAETRRGDYRERTK